MTIMLGTMSFGEPGTREHPEINTVDQAREVLDVFQSYGHSRLDTARTYGEGTAEVLLAAVGWQERGLCVDTKLFPSAGHPLERGAGYTHSAADVRRGLLDSLKALDAERVETFFLHGPDRKHPFEETLEAVNNLRLEGRFQRFGLSNYPSWEVARICEICDRRGWPRPAVYEGHYNALMRRTEDELFPCLRYYGMSFHVYSPLCSGFLTGQYSRGVKVADIPNLHLRSLWNPLYFDGLDVLQAAAKKHGLTLPELCLRWLVHHSNLRQDLGDAILTGAANAQILESNLEQFEKGPLPDEVVKAVDAAWFACRAGAPKYWY
ncbi:hypothetical protein DL768_006030 [Monosporascus sp. mg162]|nr:hypothetical protein DL768_006030 [Monosporascus sp. mg162]